MILRRFMVHMKEQNWFAVGLDVIVVIVGIFLGIQVADWNEERIEKIDEKVYLERILLDMEQSDELQTGQINRLKRLDPNLERVTHSFHNKTKEEGFDESFILSVIEQAASARPLTVFVTIDELKSAGKFNLIRSAEIRNAIGELQQSYELTFDLTRNRQRIMAEFLPILAKYYTVALRVVPWQNDLGEAAKTYVMDDETFSSLANDDNFVAAATWAATLNNGQMNDLKEHNAKTKQLATLIEQYLASLR